MNKRTMAVHEVAALTGITARTLHYYDEIDLLKPSIITKAKYRQYTDEDLSKLKEILFFREVGFALKEIKELLNTPNYNRTDVLNKHLVILEAQKERINALIALVKKEIEGAKELTFSAFSNEKIVELQAQFRAEVLERWKNTKAFKEFETVFSPQAEKIQNEQMENFYSTAQSIFEKLSMYENDSADCPEVQSIVCEWQQYISEHFYECNEQILSYLGVLYITDERFTDFINRFGRDNLAGFFSKAIEVYCENLSKSNNQY